MNLYYKTTCNIRHFPKSHGWSSNTGTTIPDILPNVHVQTVLAIIRLILPQPQLLSLITGYAGQGTGIYTCANYGGGGAISSKILS